jgi:hypothetical protein
MANPSIFRALDIALEVSSIFSLKYIRNSSCANARLRVCYIYLTGMIGGAVEIHGAVKLNGWLLTYDASRVIVRLLSGCTEDPKGRHGRGLGDSR